MYIKIKVQAGSSKEAVRKMSDDHFEIDVCQPAKQNQANRRVLELIKLRFPGSGPLRIVSGHRSPSKIISISESK